MTGGLTLSSAFARESDLSPVDRLVLTILDRTDRRYDACLLATRTIADRIGRSVRTVQLALKRLSLRGWIKNVRATGLRTGHRILLLWRGDRTPLFDPPSGSDLRRRGTSGLGAMDCASEAQRIAPDFGPPYVPPLEGSEDNTLLEMDDNPARSSSSMGDLSQPKWEDPTPDAETTALAVAALGPEVATPGRVAAAVKEHGPAEVKVAVAICEARKARSPGLLGWGFVMRVLGNRKAEGYPAHVPAPACAAPAAPAPRNAALARQARMLAALKELEARDEAEAEGRPPA